MAGTPKRKGFLAKLAELLPLGRKRTADPTPAEKPAPAADPTPAAPAAPPFSLDQLARRLFHADNTAAALSDFATHVDKRLLKGEPVAPLEAFLAHALIDAGVNSNDVALPAMTIIRPRTSGLFYARVNEMEVPYLALLHVLGIEAALNAAHFITMFYGEEGPATEAEAWQFAHRVPASIISQMAEPTDADRRVHEALIAAEGNPDGEWAVRRFISLGIESFQLPWRLSARFRVNVAGGDVAFEADLTPLNLMWRRTSIDGVRVVPTTSEMQRRSATDYNTRLAFVLASCAFRASERIQRVWVAGTIDTAQYHSCLYSVCFDRERFLELDLSAISDPVGVLRAFDAVLDEQDGMLHRVQQSFTLDDARFCPPERFEAPEVSTRMLSEKHAHALGTASVSGLGIDETIRRTALAREISRHLGDSTAENVAAILELAENDSDPAVLSAAERTVQKLIAGTLEDDPLAIIGEFTEGDDLTSLAAHARTLLEAHELEAAAALLGAQLPQYDETYADGASVVWRVYTTYVSRVLANRLGIDADKTVLLAPAAYLELLLMHSVSLYLLNRNEEALAVARRAHQVAPLEAQAQQHIVQCLDACGRTLEAVDELKDLLSHAHDAVSIGFGFYRMAYFQWKLGNVECAQACYLRALRFLPTVVTFVAPELQVMALQGQNRLEDISDAAIDKLLEEHGIPLAPTLQIAEIFSEAMRAALDAEIFPVAKSFLITLGTLNRDDVCFGVLRSLEDEPDR